MTPFEIPLIPSQNQKFSARLNGVTYTFQLKWCTPAACWSMDILDGNQNPIIQGVPLITGADLLQQFEYLGFGGEFVVQTDYDVYAVPQFDNLGTTGHLYYVTNP